MIERQIIRRMTALIPLLDRRRSGYRRGKLAEPDAFLARYRSNLAAITAERQPEVDVLSRKLAGQDAAIRLLQRQIEFRSKHERGAVLSVMNLFQH